MPVNVSYINQKLLVFSENNLFCSYKLNLNNYAKFILDVKKLYLDYEDVIYIVMFEENKQYIGRIEIYKDRCNFIHTIVNSNNYTNKIDNNLSDSICRFEISNIVTINFYYYSNVKRYSLPPFVINILSNANNETSSLKVFLYIILILCFSIGIVIVIIIIFYKKKIYKNNTIDKIALVGFKEKNKKGGLNIIQNYYIDNTSKSTKKVDSVYRKSYNSFNKTSFIDKGTKKSSNFNNENYNKYNKVNKLIYNNIELTNTNKIISTNLNTKRSNTSKNFDLENKNLKDINTTNNINKYFDNIFKPFYYIESKKNQTTCTICMERFFDESLVSVLICNHLYHSECLRNMLKLNKTNCKCPNCNSSILNIIN